MVERLTCNEDVAGSTPVSGSGQSEQNKVGFPSGQREQTVNLSAKPSEVQILPPPPPSLMIEDLFFLQSSFFLRLNFFGHGFYDRLQIVNPPQKAQ